MLKTRLREYKSNLNYDPQEHTVNNDHIIEFNHSFDWCNCKILNVEPLLQENRVQK